MRTRSRREFLTLGVTALGAAALAACGGDDAPTPGATPRPSSGDSTATPAVPTPSSTVPRSTTPAGIDGPTGFAFPIAGACLPTGDQLMPNAPRTYRNGVHEGLDFYPGYACAPIAKGTPIMAAYDGVVVRADLDYKDITLKQVDELAAKTAAQGFSDPVTLDIYRGRQVWVDHGNGLVTRYCHLNSIEGGLRVGSAVKQGQVICGVGESGTPESITAPGTELHLHFEVRVGDSFLGANLPPATVRALYEHLFDPKNVRRG